MVELTNIFTLKNIIIYFANRIKKVKYYIAKKRGEINAFKGYIIS